jgi:hypothetical protein
MQAPRSQPDVKNHSFNNIDITFLTAQIVPQNATMSETRYSQRIPESKWQFHKTTIHRLYVLENKPLTASEGVRDTMFARHGFMAT